MSGEHDEEAVARDGILMDGMTPSVAILSSCLTPRPQTTTGRISRRSLIYPADLSSVTPEGGGVRFRQRVDTIDCDRKSKIVKAIAQTTV
jgi:hypothetical protein